MQTNSDSAMPRRLLAMVWGLALLYFAFAQMESWRQYAAGEVVGDAVQTFDVALSRAAAGEGLLLPQSGNHFFTNHVMLWLYPAAMVYRVADSLWTYITIVNLALALAVPALGLLAWSWLRSRPLVLAVCLFFCANQFVGSLRFALHPENLCLPLWLLLFWAMREKRKALMFVSAAGLLCVKEDMAAWLAIVALWAWWMKRLPRTEALQLLALAIGGGLLIALIHFLAPRTGSSDFGVGLFWLNRFSTEGDPSAAAQSVGVLDILRRIVLNPTWLGLVFGGGIVCVLGWRAMIPALPAVLAMFAMQSPLFRHLNYYYSYTVLPFLLLAMVEGLHYLRTRWPRHAREMPLAAIILLLAAVHCFLPTRTNGWRQHPRFHSAEMWDRVQGGRKLVQMNVPRDARIKVAAHYKMGAWVPRGRQLMQLNEATIDDADMVLLDRIYISADLGEERYVRMARSFIEPDSPWRVIDEVAGYVVLEKQRWLHGGCVTVAPR